MFGVDGFILSKRLLLGPERRLAKGWNLESLLIKLYTPATLAGLFRINGFAFFLGVSLTEGY